MSLRGCTKYTPKHWKCCGRIASNYAVQFHSHNCSFSSNTFAVCDCLQQHLESCYIFVLHFYCVVAVVLRVLTFLARNLSHRKEGRGEGRKDNSFSSSLSSGNMDETVFADLDLSMSTDAKGSTDKLL